MAYRVAIVDESNIDAEYVQSISKAWVQDFKCAERNRLIHNCIGELNVLFPRPVEHFPGLFLAYIASLCRRITLKVVIPDRMVEDGTKLVVNGLEI